MSVTIHIGDCRDVLRSLASESVHCVVTSPPYWGLRDYGVDGQMGMESSLGEHVEGMVEVFRQVWRVLRKDGTLWLNYGDSYASQPSGSFDNGQRGGGALEGGGFRSNKAMNTTGNGLKPKDLCGIPWRVALALQADGWYLRQDIIWSKPNPMPESVRDRCTKAHEYIFLLSKSERYYYDAEAIAEAATFAGKIVTLGEKSLSVGQANGANVAKTGNALVDSVTVKDTRNRRSVWEIATAPFPEAHFATFPPALIEPCILAGCPAKCCAKCGAPRVREIEAESADGRKGIVRGGKAYDENGRPLAGDNMIDHGVRGSFNVGAKGTLKRTTIGFSPSCNCNAEAVPGTCLDPFGGAGTTGLVADRLGRNAILIELNPEYAAMAERRIADDAGMFAQVAAE